MRTIKNKAMKRIIFYVLFVFGSFGVNAQTLPNTGVGTKLGNSVIGDSVSVVKKKGIEVNSIKVWKNGVSVDAVDLDVDVAYEDLDKMVRFYYQLKDSTGAQIANGNVEITGDEYEDYKTKPNHAQRAYVIVLRYLKLQQKAAK
jgi:hypothetical protein